MQESRLVDMQRFTDSLSKSLIVFSICLLILLSMSSSGSRACSWSLLLSLRSPSLWSQPHSRRSWSSKSKKSLPWMLWQQSSISWSSSVDQNSSSLLPHSTKHSPLVSHDSYTSNEARFILPLISKFSVSFLLLAAVDAWHSSPVMLELVSVTKACRGTMVA